MYEPIWKIFRKLISFLVQLIISLFSNFFSSVRHLANHRNGCFLIVPDLMVRNYWDETPFVRLEENSNWKEALHLRFYYYLDLLQTNKHPIRSTCTRQSRNASCVWNFCGAFLRKPSSDRDPGVISWVGRKKKVRDIFQARGSSAHARRRFCRAFSLDPVTTPGSLRMLVGNL